MDRGPCHCEQIYTSPLGKRNTHSQAAQADCSASGEAQTTHNKQHEAQGVKLWSWVGRKLLCGGGGGDKEAHFPNSPPPPWPL